ncbi:MAG: hypothetical protein EOP61_36950 [Sphingomonadales bacterium]|nr:MAG: hypothetical protein EOP61_36950 [Sphingomonadales bacterium]
MLCCGLLTLVAATILGLWRWLRRMPRGLLVTGGVVLIASPALALSLAQPAEPLDRADVIERAMQSLCGGR